MGCLDKVKPFEHDKRKDASGQEQGCLLLLGTDDLRGARLGMIGNR